jgi:flagellar biosynthesis/type III secretory pathway protein FliH
VDPARSDPGAAVRVPDPDAVERDAFARGYAAGEQAGAEAGLARLEGLHRRLAQAIDDIAAERRRVLLESERSVVQLALAIARRVLRRECSTHPAVIASLAHGALGRLGVAEGIEVRVNPADAAALAQAAPDDWPPPGTVVVPDPLVERGGAVLESPAGAVEATLEAQFEEIARALLGDATQEAA